MEKFKGSAAIFISALMYGSYGVWANLIGSNFGLFFQTYVRALIAWCIICAIVLIGGHWKKIGSKYDLKILMIIALVGTLTQIIYYSYQTIGVGLTSVFQFSATLASQYFIAKYLFSEK